MAWPETWPNDWRLFFHHRVSKVRLIGGRESCCARACRLLVADQGISYECPCMREESMRDNRGEKVSKREGGERRSSD